MTTVLAPLGPSSQRRWERLRPKYPVRSPPPERRFQPVHGREPAVEDIMAILSSVADGGRDRLSGWQRPTS